MLHAAQFRVQELKELVLSRQIDMEWPSRLMETPSPQVTTSIDENRIRGMLLGLAIGDSLGNTTEGLLPRERRTAYGEIRDYLPNRHDHDQRVGLPSDDTQLAFWTLEHLLNQGGILPAKLAQDFTSRQIFGIGKSTRQFVRAIKEGRPWLEASQPTAGNGALTRIPAVTVPYIFHQPPTFWADAILATAVTHNDSAAIGASLAFAAIFLDLLSMTTSPTPYWWVEKYVTIASQIENSSNILRPRGGPLTGQWSGPLWQFVRDHVPRYLDQTVLDASAIWYSGAYLLETVPTALHILAKHFDEPNEAIIRAVNDTKDNDSIASIVAAAVGARYGIEVFPQEWISRLLGRTGADDDGRIFEIMEASIEHFVPQDSSSLKNRATRRERKD